MQIKWLGGPELYTARIIARITSFTYEVHIQQQWVICIGWHKRSMSHLQINYNNKQLTTATTTEAFNIKCRVCDSVSGEGLLFGQGVKEWARKHAHGKSPSVTSQLTVEICPRLFKSWIALSTG